MKYNIKFSFNTYNVLRILLGIKSTNMNNMDHKELSLKRREKNNYNVVLSVTQGYPLTGTK